MKKKKKKKKIKTMRTTSKIISVRSDILEGENKSWYKSPTESFQTFDS